MKLRLTLGLALGAVAVLVMACGGDKEPVATQPTAAARQVTTPAPAAPPPPAPVPPPTSTSRTPSAGPAVAVRMVDPGPNYSFNPKRTEVSEGQVIKLVAGKEFHTFTVKDLGIDAIVAAGADVEVKVPAGKKGTFKVICLPHEALGMVGELVVH